MSLVSARYSPQAENPRFIRLTSFNSADMYCHKELVIASCVFECSSASCSGATERVSNTFGRFQRSRAHQVMTGRPILLSESDEHRNSAEEDVLWPIRSLESMALEIYCFGMLGYPRLITRCKEEVM